MKRILLIFVLIAAAFSAACAADSAPAIKFDVKKFDFGTIKEADGPVSTDFAFVNEGTAPLIIKAAYGSCNCTVPSYPMEPIAAGQSGVIKVTYDPAHKSGEVSATVTVVTNDKKHKRVKLMIKGVVVPKGKNKK